MSTLFDYLSFYICVTVLCNRSKQFVCTCIYCPLVFIWVVFWVSILRVCQTAFWIDRFHWLLSFIAVSYCMHLISWAYSFLFGCIIVW